MSSQYNSFRNRRYIRSRFLDGRFLLSQEASDLELEVLEYARRIVQNSLGDIAIGDAWKTEIIPLSLGISNSQEKLIVRPGIAYYNGLLFEMTSGTDHKVSADANQPVTIGTPNDPGGKILDFSSRPTGYYKVLSKAIEEKVTADQDAFLKGAAVPENTEEKRRLIYSLSAVPCDANGNIAGKDPLNFTRTDDITSGQQSQFFKNNDKFQIDRTPNSITPTSDTLGTSVVVTFSNSDGAGTIFPTGVLMSQVFAGGLFIDPDGAVYFINAVQVTTGPDQVSFFLDQELAVPAGSGLQPNPNLGTSGLKYTLIPADVVIADSSSGLPVGTRNYPIAEVYWNGTDFSMSPFGFSSSGGSVQYNIRDLRATGTAESIATITARALWQLTGGGNVKWDLPNQNASWDANIIVKVPNNSSLEYVVAPGNTFALFGSSFAENEVLYFIIPNNTSGSVSVLPQKNVRGVGDLGTFDPSEIYILAYRVGNRLHWNSDCLVLGDGETGSFGQGFFDQYLKLVRGGNWSWNLGTNTLAWDAVANVQIDGTAENRNTIPIGNVVLSADGAVAYTTVNRGSGSLANLTISTANIAAVPVNENTFVLARRVGNTVLVGSQSMLLIDAESKVIDAGLSNENKKLIGGTVNPITEATLDPEFATRGSPLRTISDATPSTNDILDQMVSMDIEIDKFFGQMRLEAANPVSTRVLVSSSDVTMLTGEERSQKISSLLLSFNGAQIDFATGNVYEADGTTPLGVNFTPVVIAANQYQWYSVSVIPQTTTSDGKLSGQLLILPGNGTGASAALAQKAPFPSNGIPLGQVVVQENGGGSAINNILQTAIIQLGIGSGSGSGSGDTTDALTRMELWHDSSPYEFLTPTVFETDIDTQTQSSSVPFDYATNSYKLGIGQNWVSKQRLDDEFLSESRDVGQAELALIFNQGFVDPNPTVEISRDGGSNYQSFPVQRVSPNSDSYRGELFIQDEPMEQPVSSYDVSNANTAVVLNATSAQQRSEPFTLTDTQVVETIVAYISKTGTPAGNVSFRLVRDDGTGKPSTALADILVESNLTSIGGLSAGNNIVTTPIPPTVLIAGTYHLVSLTDIGYKNTFSAGVNEIDIRADNSAPTAPNSTVFDGTTWTIVSGTALVYLLTGRLLEVRIRITSSVANAQLAAVGVLYGPLQANLKGIKNREVFVFDGASNLDTFTLTTFLPDPDLLMIFEPATGQVYVNGGFSISGQIITFPANTFNKPGEAVTLIAVQPVGNSFDNSDRNAALLAANHLGSTDPSIDQSVVGRGIFLRRPDGTLREITIDNSDNIQVWSV